MNSTAERAMALAQQVIKRLRDTLAEEHVPPFVKRDAHPHMHGCVQAELIVHDDIRQELRHGVLAYPGRRYRVWARFSNAFDRGHDLAATPRGLALKLLDVDGPRLDSIDDERDTQDFLFATHDAFFLPDPRDYVEFLQALRAGGPRLLWFFASKPRLWRGAVALFKSRGVLARNPLAIPYFSQTPYRLGPDLVIKLRMAPVMTPRLKASLPGAVAFRLKAARVRFVHVLPKLGPARSLLAFVRIPATPAWARQVSERIAPPDLLRRAMRAYLAEHEATFELSVQRSVKNTKATPVEDASRRWAPSKAPFEPVATLRIPRQVFWPEPGMPREVERQTSAMVDLGEHMSFTPWHGLQDHEPVGEINVIRRAIYAHIAAYRREQNGRMADAIVRAQTGTYDRIRAVVQPAADPAAVHEAGERRA